MMREVREETWRGEKIEIAPTLPRERERLAILGNRRIPAWVEAVMSV